MGGHFIEGTANGREAHYHWQRRDFDGVMTVQIRQGVLDQYANPFGGEGRGNVRMEPRRAVLQMNGGRPQLFRIFGEESERLSKKKPHTQRGGEEKQRDMIACITAEEPISDCLHNDR